MHNLVEILDIAIFSNKKTNKSKYRPICQQSERDSLISYSNNNNYFNLSLNTIYFELWKSPLYF